MSEPKEPKATVSVRISDDRCQAHAEVISDEPMSFDTITEKFALASAMSEMAARQEWHAQAH